MALNFHSGLETGTLTEWQVTSGTVAVSTSHPRTGSYELRVNPTSSTAYVYTDASTNRISVGMYIASAPSADTCVVGLNIANYWSLYLTTARTVDLYEGTTKRVTGTTVLSTGTYHRLSLTVNDSDGHAYYWLNGTAEGDYDGTATITYQLVGAYVSCTTDLYFDDFSSDITAGATTDLGDYREIGKVPTANTNGAVPWTNPSNAYASDTSYATAVYVARATPTFRAAGTQALGTTSAVTPGLPAGLANGDIVFLVASTIAGGSISITTNGSIGTWTAVGSSPIDVTGGEKLYVWWGRYTSGSTSASVQASSDHINSVMVAYYNCVASGSPIDVVASSTEASDTSFSFATGLTSTYNNERVICICSTGTDNTTAQFTTMANTSLTSLAERYDDTTSNGGGGGFAFDEGLKATAGTLGTFTSTLSTASSKAYIAFALLGTAAVSVLDHIFGTFGLVPAGTVVRVDVGYEAFATATQKLNLYTSANGGSSWSSAHDTGNIGTADPAGVYTWVNCTADQTWTDTLLNDTNFKVKVETSYVSGTPTWSLDSLFVRVVYLAVASTPYTENSTCSLSLSVSTVSRTRTITRTSTSNMGLTTSATRQIARSRAATPLLSLAAAATKVFGKTLNSTSNMSLTTSATRQWAHTAASTSNLSLTAFASRSWAHTVAAIAYMELAALATRSRGSIRDATTNLSLTAVSVTKNWVRSISGVLAGVGTTVGSIVRQRSIIGTASGVGTIIGNVARTRGISGVTTGVGTLVGAIIKMVSIVGVTAGVGTLIGAIVRTRGIVGNALGVGTLAGFMVAQRALKGTVGGVGTLIADIKRQRPLAGVLSGIGDAAGILTLYGQILLTGVTSGVGTLAGAIVRTRAIQGTVTGVGTLAGDLTNLATGVASSIYWWWYSQRNSK